MCILEQQGLDCSAGAVPYTAIKSREQLAKVSVLALVFCLSIVLANLSLRFIPVSFNQARSVLLQLSRWPSMRCCSIDGQAVSAQRSAPGHGSCIERCPTEPRRYTHLLFVAGDWRHDAGIHGGLRVPHSRPHRDADGTCSIPSLLTRCSGA